MLLTFFYLFVAVFFDFFVNRYSVIVPICILLVLKHLGNLRDEDPAMMYRWGLIHSGYRAKKYWWEMTIVARKLVIITISSFVTMDTLQLHVALGLLIVALHFHDTNRPFGKDHGANRVLHRFEMSSLLALIFLLWSGVFFSLGVVGSKGDTWGGWVLVVGVLLMNVCFLLYLLGTCLGKWSKKKKLDRKFNKATQRITSLFRNSMALDHGNKKNRKINSSNGRNKTKKNKKKDGKGGGGDGGNGGNGGGGSGGDDGLFEKKVLELEMRTNPLANEEKMKKMKKMFPSGSVSSVSRRSTIEKSNKKRRSTVMEMVDMVDDKTWINVEESADGDCNSDGVGDGASGASGASDDSEIDLGWEAF